MTKFQLFAEPSFISGVSRVLDLGSTLNEYNSSPTPEMADHIALQSDWQAVGADIQIAMSSNESSHGTEEK